jgi:Concanavalin A-like lectin/glucanases superfamily/Galactose oxidase-like, Early set domain/Bacterial Ig domain/Carboxypeptidase regulatory-like domain/Kelch motif
MQQRLMMKMIMSRFRKFFLATLFALLAQSASAAIAIDVTTAADLPAKSSTVATPVFSTASGNELLLAFVSGDYISGSNTTVTNVTGGGLTWALVVRTNVQSGTAEIWRAFATSPLTNVAVTATLSQSVIASLTVMSFTGVDGSGTNGSGAIGAIRSANSASGAPTGTVVTTRANSWVFGVGTDYDNPIARTPGTGQSLVHQYLTPAGDTYWVQKQNSSTALGGASVTINDTAPTTDRYNLSVVEILAATAQTWTLSGTISPFAGGSGALVTLVGTQRTTVTDASGNYSFTGVPNGPYNLVPSKAGYAFFPLNQSGTVNGASVSGLNFSATPTTWSISGTITPSAGGSGATVVLSGPSSATVTADSSGNYSFSGVANGTYTVTPSKVGYSYAPVSQSVTVSGLPVSGVNFAAQTMTSSISGTITPASLGSGATVTVAGALITATADGFGNYSLSGVPNGTFTVTARKPGYTFSPLNRVVTTTGGAVTGVDFTIQTSPGWTISGTISPALAGGGATVSLTGPASATTTADSAGNFSFTNVADGAYVVTPTKTGRVFAPASLSATVNGADVSGMNFTAQVTSWSVSGTISPALSGSGATVTLSGPASATVTADSAGNFSFTNVADGSYAVTPSKSGYLFSPSSLPASVNGADVTGMNFTAQAATYSISGTISPASAGSGAVVGIGETGDVIADSSGHFNLHGYSNGMYPVGVNKPGYTFTPSIQNVTIDGADVSNVNFTGTVDTTSPAGIGQWSAPFELGIVAVNTVMLRTGKVLMYSGSFAAAYTERVWDPATGSITLVPNPYFNLFCSGHSQLADGRILVVGGFDPPSIGAANANIFDPVTQTWSALPNMAYRRWYPTSTTLPDGRALVTSGAQTCLTCLADIPEVFDPATNQFTKLTSARLAVPYYPFMYVLPDGKVIDAGANEDTVATQKLDMTTGTWSMVDSNVKDGHSSAMYRPGKILKSGTAADSGTAGNAAATAYVLDATQPSAAWRQVASMAYPRAFHNTTLLPDGNVLVTGGGTILDGYDVTKAVKNAELWSPTTETWQTMSAASKPRLYHSTALLLPDGRVLTAGSGNDGPAVNQTMGELFSPPYLFKGARPTISGAPDLLSYGAAFTVATPDAASIASVSLIRPGAVTHGFDEDQRFLNLSFTGGMGLLTIQAPANANLAPPGYYMLFIVNNAGVPSVATFVHFAAPGVDAQPPSAPTGLSGQGAIGSATLTWTASTDNTGVALYNVHRSTTTPLQPSAANRIGQPTTTGFTDVGVTAGTYFYVVTAQDIAGNVSGPSSEASVYVFADTTAPTVTMTAPAEMATVTGSILVQATASDDIAVAGVQFQIDGQPIGAERTSAPYSVTWDSATKSNGLHVLTAIARDAAGNTSPASVNIVVSNTSQTPGGLVAAYGFNQGSGVQVTDASGQGNIGTISSATWTAAGKFGSALSFNGTSAWVTVADSASLDLTSGLTIEAWVNPTSGSAWRTVVLKENTGALAYALYSANNASRPATFVHTSADFGVNGVAAVPLNAWTHLSVTYDGATLRLFVNGVQASSRAVTGLTVATTGALRIGGNSVWGEYFKGLIDEVRIYNRALTAAEIQTDMTTPIP